MCCALARACGSTPAWALELLRGHPATFDAFWFDSFGAPGGGDTLPPPVAAPCDIDEILGRE